MNISKFAGWASKHQVELLHILGGLSWIPPILFHLHWLWLLPWVGGVLVSVSLSIVTCRFFKNKYRSFRDKKNRDKEASERLSLDWSCFVSVVSLKLQLADSQNTCPVFLAREISESFSDAHKRLNGILLLRPGKRVLDAINGKLKQIERINECLQQLISQNGLFFHERFRKVIESLNLDADLCDFDRLVRIRKEQLTVEGLFKSIIPDYEKMEQEIRSTIKSSGLSEAESVDIINSVHSSLWSAQWHHASRLHTYHDGFRQENYQSRTFGRNKHSYVSANGKSWDHTVAGYDVESKNLFLRVMKPLIQKAINEA